MSDNFFVAGGFFSNSSSDENGVKERTVKSVRLRFERKGW